MSGKYLGVSDSYEWGSPPDKIRNSYSMQSYVANTDCEYPPDQDQRFYKYDFIVPCLLFLLYQKKCN